MSSVLLAGLSAALSSGCNPNPPERRSAPAIESQTTGASADEARFPDPAAPYLPLDGSEPRDREQAGTIAGAPSADQRARQGLNSGGGPHPYTGKFRQPENFGRAAGENTNAPGQSNTAPGAASGNVFGTQGRAIRAPSP